MANTGFNKRRNPLPEIKDNRKKNLPLLPPKELNTLGQSNVQKVAENYLTVRGHIVPGYSQIHTASSGSETVSETDLTTKRNSKLRTMKVQPVSEKSLIMEKFESSLKERLLSSTHFSKQVPLFDGMAVKEKGRMKTPIGVDYDDLSKNESIFNAVFPARKESGRHGSPNDKLFTEHNKESIDWLKQIENDAQVDDVQSSLSNKTSKDEINLKKITNLSKKIKKGTLEKKLKQEKTPQNDSITGPLEQLKFLSSPRLSSKVGEKGSSRSKIAKEKYKINMSESKKIILPKLSSKNTSEKESENVILESRLTMDPKVIKGSNLPEVNVDNVSKLEDSSLSKKEISSTETLADISRKKLNLCINSSSSFRNASEQNIQVNFVSEDISEKESVDMYSQGGIASNIKKRPITSSPFKVISQSTSLETGESSSFSKPSITRGHTGGDSLMHYDEYNILYFQTEKDSAEKIGQDDPASDEGLKMGDISQATLNPSDVQTPSGQEDSNATAALDHIAEPVAVQDEMEEEELPKEMKEGEEDCTAEPCNEPTWFEEYGIDRKSRKNLEEEVKSEESLEGEFGEAVVTVEEEVPQEVIHGDEDILEAKKKKIKKTRPAEMKEHEEDKESAPEIEEFESETVREIKTIPLVTLDQIPAKERPIVEEKPLSQMPSEYLKKYVTNHLVAGLAQVALHMPSDPVEYLAHWLIRERKKEELLEEFKQFKSEVREVRKKNIDEIRRKLQLDYLQNEALKRYHEGKYEPLYPVFDSSESDLDFRGMEEGDKTKEEEIVSNITDDDRINK